MALTMYSEVVTSSIERYIPPYKGLAGRTSADPGGRRAFGLAASCIRSIIWIQYKYF